jgi:hypothetical protein
MFSFGAVSEFAFSDIGTEVIPVPPIVIFDKHDGGKNVRKKQDAALKAAARKRDARLQEIVAIYEEVVEGKPRAVAQIVGPYAEGEFDGAIPADAIDFEALLADMERVKALRNEFIEMDDEEVLLLI